MSFVPCAYSTMSHQTTTLNLLYFFWDQVEDDPVPRRKRSIPVLHQQTRSGSGSFEFSIVVVQL